MRQNCTLITSQSAASATRLDNTPVQSAVPATKKRPDNIDSFLKYCACHAKRNISTLFARKSTSCTSYDRHFLSTAHRRLSDLIANGCESLRTARRPLANKKTTLSEHNSNLQTFKVKREPFTTHSGKSKTRGITDGIPTQQHNQEQDCRQTKRAASLIDHPKLPLPENLSEFVRCRSCTVQISFWKVVKVDILWYCLGSIQLVEILDVTPGYVSSLSGHDTIQTSSGSSSPAGTTPLNLGIGKHGCQDAYRYTFLGDVFSTRQIQSESFIKNKTTASSSKLHVPQYATYFQRNIQHTLLFQANLI